MFDFDVKELPNIKFSHSMLLEYYNEVKANFQHLKWTPDNRVSEHNVKKLYSWAIQSNLKDVSKPCPPYNIKHDNEVIGSFDNLTDLVFGFGQLVVDCFPDVRQTVISVHPSTTEIKQHIDNDEFFKIHIPIETNSKSCFVFGDKKYNLEVGKAYFINTKNKHGTINNGNTDRAHLIFKIPHCHAEKILNEEFILDPNYYDFDIKEINYDFNFGNLLSYYNELEQNFSNMKWQVPDMSTIPENKRPPGNENASGIHGYGIQSNLKDIEQPCPAYNNKSISKEEKIRSYTNKTKMFYGFAEKLFNDFDNVEEMVITGHPPKSGIGQHIDSYTHFRIHFPIIANNESHFIYGDKKYVLNTKKAYIVNTARHHGTFNNGKTDRVHLLFKVPLSKVNNILKKYL